MFKPVFCADVWCADFCADFCAHVYVDFWCAAFCADFCADFTQIFLRRFGASKIGVPESRKSAEKSAASQWPWVPYSISTFLSRQHVTQSPPGQGEHVSIHCGIFLAWPPLQSLAVKKTLFCANFGR